NQPNPHPITIKKNPNPPHPKNAKNHPNQKPGGGYCVTDICVSDADFSETVYGIYFIAAPDFCRRAA
ncbi:MAG: hypothetical protein LUG55_01135, partial [Clostridiales bacterium]|nr:hypothetical protein [Clostridiales bacterium]